MMNTFTHDQEKRYFAIRRELDKLNPNHKYENDCVATAIALGKYNADWLRNSLILRIEDGAIDYEEAVKLNRFYQVFAKYNA